MYDIEKASNNIDGEGFAPLYSTYFAISAAADLLPATSI